MPPNPAMPRLRTSSDREPYASPEPTPWHPGYALLAITLINLSLWLIILALVALC